MAMVVGNDFWYKVLENIVMIIILSNTEAKKAMGYTLQIKFKR